MRTLSSYLSALASLWKSTLVRGGVIFATIVGFCALIARFVGGYDDFLSFIEWLKWFYERTNTSWIGLFMLILVGGLLFFGILRVVEAAQRGSLVDHEFLQRETAAQKKAVEIPNALARNLYEMLIALEAEERCRHLRHQVQIYASMVPQIKSENELRRFMWSFGDYREFEIPRNFNENVSALAKMIGVNYSYVSFKENEGILVDTSEFHALGPRMGEESRKEYQAAIEENSEKLENAISWLENKITERKSKILRHGREILDKVDVLLCTLSS